MSIYNFKRKKGVPLMLKNGKDTNRVGYLTSRWNNNNIVCSCDLIVEFKTEAEGVKLAKLYKKLADNPTVRLNIVFKKIIK